MLKPTDFKYKIRTKDDKIYSVAVRYDNRLTKATNCKSYACSLRDDDSGLIVGVVGISGAKDATQALIWLQYREICTHYGHN